MSKIKKKVSTMTADMYIFSLHENYQEKYNYLKQKFIEIASLHINATNLQALKQFYDGVVNSKRVLDSIKNLLDLIKILEKRFVLSYYNIEPLKYIASKFIRDPVLDEAIKEYELQLLKQQQLPPLNLYKCKSGEYLNQFDGENSPVVIKVNPSEESTTDSEESRLLCSNAICDYSQPSDEILRDRKNSDQIVSSQVSFPNINRHNFMHVIDINIVHNFYSLNRITNNSCYRYTFIRAIMVLVIVISCLVFITFALKPSVSPIPSIPSSTSIRDDSGFNPASQAVLLNSSTAFQPSHQPHHQVPREPERSNHPTTFQIEVFQYLSENLGRSWRDLARFLDVKEAEIDSIDLKTHYDYKNRALEALEIFRKRCGSCDWKKKLIKSLEIIRRKDLAEHVTDMILQSDNK